MLWNARDKAHLSIVVSGRSDASAKKCTNTATKDWPASKLINKMTIIQARRPTRMTSIQASRATHREAPKEAPKMINKMIIRQQAQQLPNVLSPGAPAGGAPRGLLPRAAGAGPRAPVRGRRPVPRGKQSRGNVQEAILKRQY